MTDDSDEVAFSFQLLRLHQVFVEDTYCFLFELHCAYALTVLQSAHNDDT